MTHVSEQAQFGLFGRLFGQLRVLQQDPRSLSSQQHRALGDIVSAPYRPQELPCLSRQPSAWLGLHQCTAKGVLDFLRFGSFRCSLAQSLAFILHSQYAGGCVAWLSRGAHYLHSRRLISSATSLAPWLASSPMCAFGDPYMSSVPLFSLSYRATPEILLIQE
ncbi:hypothetical protein B0H12DRAFT_775099 [Mycena haematopus]|nr:hypothetical protein B0H12DRAFT_775099 [Mycena haematopus]